MNTRKLRYAACVLTAALAIAGAAPAAGYGQTTTGAMEAARALPDMPYSGKVTLDGRDSSLEAATVDGNACTTTAYNTLACQSDTDIATVNRQAVEALKAGKLPPGTLVAPPRETVARILGDPAAPGARAALASCGGRSDSHVWTGGQFNDAWWHGGYIGNSYWSFPGVGGGTWDNSVTSYKDSEYYYTNYWDGSAQNGDWYGGGWDKCSEAQSLATGNPGWNNRFSSMRLSTQ